MGRFCMGQYAFGGPAHATLRGGRVTPGSHFQRYRTFALLLAPHGVGGAERTGWAAWLGGYRLGTSGPSGWFYGASDVREPGKCCRKRTMS